MDRIGGVSGHEYFNKHWPFLQAFSLPIPETGGDPAWFHYPSSGNYVYSYLWRRSFHIHHKLIRSEIEAWLLEVERYVFEPEKLQVYKSAIEQYREILKVVLPRVSGVDRYHYKNFMMNDKGLVFGLLRLSNPECLYPPRREP